MKKDMHISNCYDQQYKSRINSRVNMKILRYLLALYFKYLLKNTEDEY